MSSESHAAFHVASKGIARMGVCSSSGGMRARCSGFEAAVDVLLKVIFCEVVCLKLSDVVYCFV